MASILKPEKTPKADLEGKRFLYFEIGLVVVLSLVLAAFSWPAPKDDFYFEPVNKDTSNFYVAQEVYMFKPLPESQQVVKQPTKKVSAVKPVKVAPVVVKPIVQPPEPLVIQPVVEPPQPDTIAITNKGDNANSNPLPANLIKVDKKPQFPGGEAAMNDFIRNNIKYSDFARRNNFSGTVYLKFMVGADGRLFDLKVEKGVRNSGLNEEVIRVFSMMPLWEPGYRNGKPAPFLVSYPVRFEFEN